MSDDRNFRSFYYEKVGFRGVEGKKSLDKLLAKKPSDMLSKLSSFAQQFEMPGIYRKQIWKLLLDVIKANELSEDSNQFVMTEQYLLFSDIRRALEIMLLTGDSTPNSELLVLMFFLEFSELDINIDKQFQKSDSKDLLVISDVLVKEFISDNNNPTDTELSDTYWLFRNLISSIRSNFSALIETYEKFINGLALEDKGLHCHLVKNGIIRGQTNSVNNCRTKKDFKKYSSTYRPIITWFVRFYAGIVDQYFLIRIFDRVIGALIHGTRPFVVLCSVGKAILSQFRNELLDLNTCEEITKRLLSPLTMEQSEQVIIKALSQ